MKRDLMCLVDGSQLCHCGKRRGLHRYGDECCPNPKWKCGNGEDQWWAHRKFVAFKEREIVDAIEPQAAPRANSWIKRTVHVQ